MSEFENDTDLMASLARKSSSFAADIRAVKPRVASKDLMNQFDKVGAEQARDLLSDGDIRSTLKDPRMTRWMQENGMATDEVTLDRMIQNRLIPSSRKITQYAPNATNGQKLGKHTGNDIQWRPRREVEQDNFCTPEEARLPHAVSTAGSMRLDYRPTDAVYRQLVSQKLNGVQATPKIHVGRGIHAGMSYTDGTPEGSSKGATSMNLHYGLVRPELADPGLQRHSFGYQDVAQAANPALTTMPTVQQFSMPTQGEYVTRESFESTKHISMEKFTAVDYTSARVERNLRDVLRERQDTDFTRTALKDPLLYDEAQLRTQHPDLLASAPRTGADTHEAARDMELARAGSHGRSLKQAIEDARAQYVAHESRDPARSAHDLTYRPETRRGEVMAGADMGMSTQNLKERRALSGTYATIPSHGGRAPMSGPVGAVTTQRTEPFADLPSNPVRGFQQTDVRSELGATTSVRKEPTESRYTAPGRSFGASDVRAEPVTNTNGMSERKLLRTDVVPNASLRVNLATPEVGGVEQTSRRATTSAPETMTVTIAPRTQRSTAPGRVATITGPEQTGAATRGGRKVPTVILI